LGLSLDTGAQVGPYRIKGPLGRGGMASVYTAYEPSLDRDVALKVLPAEFLHDPSFAERFNREARVIARLEHPNIIPIYAFGIDEGRRLPWMAMRLVPGGALASLLKRGRLPHARVLAILRGVAEALDYAHDHGVVHRDVKPQNILLDQAERVYLADFGIAKMLEAGGGLTQTGMIAGTPQYMAPEQATATQVDRRADIYAVGIVAYEMLTGRVPFSADTPVAVLMKQVSEPLPLPAAGEVPEGVVEPLLRATAKRPDDRWPSTRAFVAALEQALSGEGGALPETLDGSARTTPQVTLTSAGGVGQATVASARTSPGPTAPGLTAPGVTAPGRTAPGRTAPALVEAPRSGASPALVVGGVLAGGGALVALGLVAAWLWLRRSPEPVVPTPARVEHSPVPYDPPATARPATPLPTPAATSVPVVPPTAPPTSRPRPSPPITVESQRPSSAPPQTQPPRLIDTPAPAPVGPSEETRTLLDDLRAGRREQRVRAALDLGDRREDAAHVVPALADALADKQDDVRLRAAEALGKFGALAKAAVPALVNALNGPDLVAAEAAKSLGKIGLAASAAVPALGAALGRSAVDVRREAARALVRLGPAAEPAVGALIEALQDAKGDRVVRQQAADALGRIGPPAASAVPALQRAASDKDGLLANKAREALAKIARR
jgi:serine/threonine-protein kinase